MASKSSKAFVSPGFISTKITEYEKQRRDNIKNNKTKLLAAGINLQQLKSMGGNLFSSKLISNSKSSTKDKNKIGFEAVEEYRPHDDEDNVYFTQSLKGNKKVMGDTQPSRKSNRTQELSSNVEEIHVPVVQPCMNHNPSIKENNVNSTPFTVDASIGDIGGSTTTPNEKSKKRVRGPTRGLKVDKLRKTFGNPIPVQIDRERMAIVGTYATPLANTLGEHIRQYAPVLGIGWEEIDFGIKESIILRAGQTFQFGDYKNDIVIRAILDSKCKSLYRNWKCKLHKRYRKLKNDVSDPENHPLAPCSKDDWVFMINNVWRKKSFKKKSKRGKNARKGLQYNHTSGSQSFVARAYMMATKENEQSFSEMFKNTHIRNREAKEGEEIWIHEKAKQDYNEIVAKNAEQLQPDVTHPRSEVQISIDVLGKRSGYLKGYGIRKSAYTSNSQLLPNTEIFALRKVVDDQAKLVAEQSKIIADQANYNSKILKMISIMATKSGVDPGSIPGLIPNIENVENTSTTLEDYT